MSHMIPRRLLRGALQFAVGLCPLLLLHTASAQTRFQVQYTSVYFDDVEAMAPAPTLGPGLQLSHGASVTSDPSLVITGNASIRLKNYAAVATNPSALPLSANTTYIVEFRYQILNYGTSPYSAVLQLNLPPAGTADLTAQVDVQPLLRTAAATGIYSAGAETAGAGPYVLTIAALADSDVVIDNITIFRQDTTASNTEPATWARLSTLPYPRLGKYQLGTTVDLAQGQGGPPFLYSVDQIESRLAFADVIVGLNPRTQTRFPESARRLRRLNPNAVILPYRIAEEQQDLSPAFYPVPRGSDVDLDYDFWQGFADAWYMRNSSRNYIYEVGYPFVHLVNISPFAPAVNGQTYFSYMLNG